MKNSASLQAAGINKEIDKLINPHTLAHRPEYEGKIAPAGRRIGPHPIKIDLDMRGKLDLVDHQHVGFQQSRPFLARDIGAHADINDVDRQIHQFRAEGCGQIVTA